MISNTLVVELQQELVMLTPEQLQPVSWFIRFLKFQEKFQHLGITNDQNLEGIEETLYLLSIPGMKESIQDGLNTPIVDCSQELDW